MFDRFRNTPLTFTIIFHIYDEFPIFSRESRDYIKYNLSVVFNVSNLGNTYSSFFKNI